MSPVEAPGSDQTWDRDLIHVPSPCSGPGLGPWLRRHLVKTGREKERSEIQAVMDGASLCVQAG